MRAIVQCAHCGEGFHNGEGYAWDRQHTGKVYHGQCLKDQRVLKINARLKGAS